MEITPEVQALLDKQAEDLKSAFDEETKGLVKTKNDLLAEKKLAQEAESEAKRLAEEAELEKAKANKDIDTVTLSYEEKLKSVTSQLSELKEQNVNSAKSQLANDFVNAHVVSDAFSRQAMAEAYKKRLDVRDGKAVVLDPNGNLTALTIEDLNKEFISASIYANHIKGSQSAGGGAEGNNGARGAEVKPKDMTAEQRIDFKKRDPQGFKKAFNLI